MHTLQHDVLSNKAGGNKTRLRWIGSVQQPELWWSSCQNPKSNMPPLAKKKSEKGIKMLMTIYNQNCDLDSKQRYLKPLVDISKAGTGIGLIMAQTKLNDAVCCWFAHFA